MESSRYSQRHDSSNTKLPASQFGTVPDDQGKLAFPLDHNLSEVLLEEQPEIVPEVLSFSSLVDMSVTSHALHITGQSIRVGHPGRGLKRSRPPN